MSDVIIDTNVMVVGNHQNGDVVGDCVDACIRFLIEARTKHVVLMDNHDEIRVEYANALRQSRPYELGAQFLFHIYQQQWNPRYVRIVELERTGAGDFVDFPDVPELANFDRSDRKFAALARKARVAVTNATDSHWVEYFDALTASGINVNFLCGRKKVEWFVR